MNAEHLIEKLFEALIAGDRPGARLVVQEAERTLGSPEALIEDVYWPTYNMIEKLFRQDQLTTLNHHCASRLLRVLVDQTAANLAFNHSRNKRILAFCGQSDADELGAQMAVDLLEAAGFTMTFGGGGIATDEILARVNDEKPDVLLMFCSAARDLPEIRALIDQLHEIGACPKLQFAVGGGVFNRADGLAEEIGADIWADTPLAIVDCLIECADQRADKAQRTVGRTKKVRKAA
jgi:methanogenic corrinoid protein MtbC1